jgi:hypothetical protein
VVIDSSDFTDPLLVDASRLTLGVPRNVIVIFVPELWPKLKIPKRSSLAVTEIESPVWMTS